MSGPVFVTGGAGFIGSHLVRALVARGDAVTVFDNLSVGQRENVPQGARLVVGDVVDAPAVLQAMAGHRAVVHLAARVAIRSSFDFAVEDTLVNVVGTAAVMRAARQCATVRRVISASSMAIYADAASAAPIDEDHATRPISPYGISKLAVEQLTHGMAAGTDISSTVLRFFNTYGPGQALSPYVGVVTIFANALRDAKVPKIFGDGHQCRDFVHVSDVAQALLLALDAGGVHGQTFNVGTGVATSVNRLYELVRMAMGSQVQAHHEPAVAGELRYSVAAIDRIRQVLGYRPVHRLDDALPEVVLAIASR